MDPGIVRLSDPEPVSDPTSVRPPKERRRKVRQKLHSPVYVSFHGPQADKVVDLSELLDLHEDGFAVQTGEMLEVNGPVTLTLDLPETRTFIHGTGQVVWSNPSGRGGIRFSALPEDSRRRLQEWLFANLLIACSNHGARKEQATRKAEMRKQNLHQSKPSPEHDGAAPAPDLSDLLSTVDALRDVIREASADGDIAFKLITEHALRLTGARGAALAFLTGRNMVCRARAGELAPPLDATVDTKHGLSGECVRSARIVACQDTENDSRVDHEACRTLGIGSLLAAPIVSDLRVVGLLEVFSSRFEKVFVKPSQPFEEIAADRQIAAPE